MVGWNGLGRRVACAAVAASALLWWSGGPQTAAAAGPAGAGRPACVTLPAGLPAQARAAEKNPRVCAPSPPAPPADVTPPVVTILNPTAGSIFGAVTITITVVASDAGSGLAAPPVVVVQQQGALPSAPLRVLGCAVNGGASLLPPAGFPTAAGATAVCSYTYTIVSGFDGVATITAWATDNAGNTGSTLR